MSLPPVVNEVMETAGQANGLLRQIAAARRNRAEKEALLNAEMEVLRNRIGPEIESFKQEEISLTDQLVALVVPKFKLLAVPKTQTIRLRDGEISIRRTPEALEVNDDEEAIIRRLRRLRLLRRFTRRGKLVLDKKALKAAPEVVKRVQGLELTHQKRLHVILPEAQGEIILSRDSLSVELPDMD